MPLLDIATTQPCFRNNVCSLSSSTFFGKEIRYVSYWDSFRIPQKGQIFKLHRGGLRIRAVATLERGPAKNVETEEQNDDFGGVRMGNYSGSSVSSVEETMELSEREKLRRMRISKANKGNTPWNKGRKHSPETLQRIRERTRLAMQNPKVKMKLANLGHAQSEETRIKIGVAVRMGWQKRRGKLMLQETCHYEWQNLIAEASRRGLKGEEELQWDSYEILNKELEKEWIQSVEERKNMPRLKGNKRAPKSSEQKRKISEAIAAKWADPDYRDRVRSALAKYHGVTDGVERKPRKKPVSDGQIRQRSSPKKKAIETDDSIRIEPESEIQRVRLRRKNTPTYKDPLASSKLEMLKNIRAQRAVVDQKKIEAITRAKELIAEAEKAAEALEMAAQKSPVAQASLIETRKLISEAIQSIESIEKDVISADANDANFPPPSPEPVRHIAVGRDSEFDATNDTPETINGWHTVMPVSAGTSNLENGHHALQDPVNGNSKALSSVEYDILGNRDEVYQMISNEIFQETGTNGKLPSTSTQRVGADGANENQGDEQKPRPNGFVSSKVEEAPSKPPATTTSEISEPKVEEVPSQHPTNTTKKWVRGRLVEVWE